MSELNSKSDGSDMKQMNTTKNNQATRLQPEKACPFPFPFQKNKADIAGSVLRQPVNDFVRLIKGMKPKIEILHIDQIREDLELQTFQDAIAASMPIVRREGDSLYCSDGWELIIEAKNKGQAQLDCLVYDIDPEKYPKSTATYLKIKDRLIPFAGAARYVEFVYRIRMLCDQLLAEGSQFYLHEHGGSRDGKAFRTDRENNIRIMLTMVLERKVEKERKVASGVSNYVAHGRYQTLDALKTMAARKDITSEFFAQLQAPKIEYVEHLMYQNKSEREIEELVSQWTLKQALPEFKSNNRIQHVVSQRFWEDIQSVSEALFQQICGANELCPADNYGPITEVAEEEIPIVSDRTINGRHGLYEIVDQAIEVLSEIKKKQKSLADARTDLTLAMTLLQKAKFSCIKFAEEEKAI